MIKDNQLRRILRILHRIDTNVMGIKMMLIGSWDMKDPSHSEFYEPRVYIQPVYSAPDSKGGDDKEWKGRKWYLSEHMTDDEIIKTCYLAFRTAVEHEILEGFKLDGIAIFNPHVNSELLKETSQYEITRS